MKKIPFGGIAWKNTEIKKLSISRLKECVCWVKKYHRKNKFANQVLQEIDMETEKKLKKLHKKNIPPMLFDSIQRVYLESDIRDPYYDKKLRLGPLCSLNKDHYWWNQKNKSSRTLDGKCFICCNIKKESSNGFHGAGIYTGKYYKKNNPWSTEEMKYIKRGVVKKHDWLRTNIQNHYTAVQTASDPKWEKLRNTKLDRGKYTGTKIKELPDKYLKYLVYNLWMLRKYNFHVFIEYYFRKQNGDLFHLSEQKLDNKKPFEIGFSQEKAEKLAETYGTTPEEQHKLYNELSGKDIPINNLSIIESSDLSQLSDEKCADLFKKSLLFSNHIIQELHNRNISIYQNVLGKQMQIEEWWKGSDYKITKTVEL